jgi:RNA polymerase sigma-70 factor, ECF subfamily
MMEMSVTALNRSPEEHRTPKGTRVGDRGPISLEDVLVSRLRAGDRAAQAELFRRHRSSLYRQAMKVLANSALADEAVQEGWINGMQAIHSFAGRSTFATWITAVVLNEARARRKREARMLSLSGSGVREQRMGSGHQAKRRDWLENQASVHHETPERHLLEKETSDRFERALESLSSMQRAVLVRRDLQGETPAQTCRTLRLTDLAHRVQLCRARARVRRALDEGADR